MKKLILALTTIIIVSASCNKNSVTTPSINTKANEHIKYANKKTKNPPKGPVYDRRPDWVEDGNKVKCPDSGTQCSVAKGSASAAQQAQLDIANNYIIKNNGNAYFTTEDWYLLFDEVNSMDEMLEQIQNNTIHLVKLNSADTYETFGLSTANTSAEANASNTVYVWKF
jgi:hypothetical protein